MEVDKRLRKVVPKSSNEPIGTPPDWFRPQIEVDPLQTPQIF